MFHIDFGYILGRDPKPMPPPMKLSKEMIEAFGGMQSDHFQVINIDNLLNFKGFFPTADDGKVNNTLLLFLGIPKGMLHSLFKPSTLCKFDIKLVFPHG